MARQLLLVRHGKIDAKHAGQYVGRSDLPLSDHGRERVGALADWLAERPIDRCLCSPRLRARQTADLIAERCGGLRLQIDDDLAEVDFGKWELRTFKQIADDSPAEVEQWASGSDDFAFPGGERRGDFRARVARAVARILDGAAPDPSDTVLAVTHGGVIQEMIRQLLDLARGYELAFEVRPATCAIVTVVDRLGVLSGLNLPAGGEGR